MKKFNQVLKIIEEKTEVFGKNKSCLTRAIFGNDLNKNELSKKISLVSHCINQINLAYVNELNNSIVKNKNLLNFMVFQSESGIFILHRNNEKLKLLLKETQHG
jgi:hypothetical protein